MRQLSWEDFAGAEGSHYELEWSDFPAFQMTLEKALQIPSGGRAGGSFRLEFRGPAEPLLPQATYSFRKGEESLEIFIVPVARDDKGALYEAIFC